MARIKSGRSSLLSLFCLCYVTISDLFLRVRHLFFKWNNLIEMFFEIFYGFSQGQKVILQDTKLL